MTSFDWSRLGFVWTFENVPLHGVLPAWVARLAVQVASGMAPSEQLPPAEWLGRARAAGFEVCAWAWCTGEDVEGEAVYHAQAARAIGAETYCANMEQAYDAGGNQADPRYQCPARYLAALETAGWTGPLGVTTTPLFASSMVEWQQAGAVFMPQSFPTASEGGYDLPTVVQHGEAWGWDRSAIRPLVQTYAGAGGVRPDAAVQNAQAGVLGVGVCPYTVEQSLGSPALVELRQAIERPTTTAVPLPPGPDNGGGGDVTKVGPQHGITAKLNYWRRAAPNECVRGAGYKESDVSTWPWPEREWRTAMIEWATHDDVTPEPSYVPPAP